MDADLALVAPVPVEYESITFPVKALKIILHDLQASVKPAEDDKLENAESDDGVRVPHYVGNSLEV
jgi:hypothetical protein